MEVVASVTATSGLASLALHSVRGSIEGLRLLSTARHFSNIADLQRSRIAFERQRLWRWYDTVEATRWSTQNALSPPDWALTRDIALQLERLLSDAAALEQRYNLELEESALEKLGQPVDHGTQSKSVLDRLVSKFRPAKPFSQTAQVIEQGANPVLRFRYTITGKTKLDELISDIEQLVSKLWQCLGETQQNFMLEGMRHLLREALNRASDQEDIEALQALLNTTGRQNEKSEEDMSLCRLPALKQKRLDLRLDVTSQESSQQQASTLPQPSVVVPATSRIKGPEVTNPKPISYSRDIASYKSQSVLVEWKRITPGLEDKLEWRIKALGVLLTQATYDTFGSLPCKGIFKDIGRNRYGFVFTLPAGEATQPEFPVRSLFAMLDDTPPSFEERMRIALHLTKSVRQLHTIGWLHKALRSENVLFCSAAHQAVERGPYLAGFGYARAADPTQFSESPPADPETDIYCHPDLMVGQAKLFRKRYDVFALGALLLEIGLWKRLSAVLLGAAGFAEADLPHLHETMTKRMALLLGEHDGGVFRELRSKCPAGFCEAVSICLQGQLAQDEADDEDSLTLQQRAVELLEL